MRNVFSDSIVGNIRIFFRAFSWSNRNDTALNTLNSSLPITIQIWRRKNKASNAYFAVSFANFAAVIDCLERSLQFLSIELSDLGEICTVYLCNVKEYVYKYPARTSHF